MLPDITITDIQETPKLGKSFLFDFTTGDFVLNDGKFIEVTGSQVVKQWIDAVLRTEKFKYLLYDDLGTETDELRSNQLPYNLFIIEVERTIKDALSVHEYIQNITNFSFLRAGSILTVTFTVTLIDNTPLEVSTIV